MKWQRGSRDTKTPDSRAQTKPGHGEHGTGVDHQDGLAKTVGYHVAQQ